jgi:hypothetical protein
VSKSKKKTRTAKAVRKFTGRFSIFSELWAFMRIRKKWWLGPILVVLLLLAVFIVLTQGTALAPFIYTLF